MESNKEIYEKYLSTALIKITKYYNESIEWNPGKRDLLKEGVNLATEIIVEEIDKNNKILESNKEHVVNFAPTFERIKEKMKRIKNERPDDYSLINEGVMIVFKAVRESMTI